MKEDATVTPADNVSSKTSVRHMLLAALTLMSVLLYLDRFAVGIASEYIREDLQMSQTQMAWFISAFFWSYALCQVPAGWLTDRFGGRTMLTVYIVAWSVLTGLMGVAHAVWLVLWLRLFCGAAQAGAYPTSVSLIRQWYPISNRGTASSIVGLGGRIGAVLAPLLTAWLILFFVPPESGSVLSSKDLIDDATFVAKFSEHQETDPPQRQFVDAFLSHLPESQRTQLVSEVDAARAELLARKNASAGQSKPLIDLRDWLPFLYGDEPDSEKRSFGSDRIVTALATHMTDAKFLELVPNSIKLVPEVNALLTKGSVSNPLSEPQTHRLNRLALESLFPKDVRKVQGPGWRPTMILYGIAGLVVALLFVVVTRNNPDSHPWCNEAERDFISDDATRAAKLREPSNPAFPWRAFLGSISLWGNSMTQFLTNIGWLFVVTWLPRYLDNVHSVPLVTKGIMTAFPSGIGVIGLYLGGRATDWAVQRFGLKRGRQIPLAASRFTAAAGYGLCLILSVTFEPSPDKTWLPWLYIVGLSIASMSTDFGSPAIWSYAQDVGGRYSASILGWGNMWGNLGAAVAPLIYNKFLGENPTIDNWNSVFALCCGVFVVAGFCAMVVDSTKPLTVERTTPQ